MEVLRGEFYNFLLGMSNEVYKEGRVANATQDTSSSESIGTRRKAEGTGGDGCQTQQSYNVRAPGCIRNDYPQ